MRNLARFGLVILAVAFALLFLFEVLRFLSELNVSPMHYVLEDAAIGLASVAGFVGCCLKFRQIGVTQRTEAAAIAARNTGAEFKGSRLEADINKPVVALALLFLAAVLLFPSFLAWVTPSIKLISFAALGIVCLAYLGAVLLAYFRAGKPTLVMDSYSFDHAWYGPIRWDQILGMQLLEFKGSRGGTQQVLAMAVAKPGRYLQQLPWVMRVFLSRKRLDAAVGDFRIPVKLLNQPASLIYAAAVELRSRVSPPALKLWYPGMSAEQIEWQRETDATLARMEQLSESLSDKTAFDARANDEMMRLSEDLNRQMEAGKPFQERDLAKLRRTKYQAYALTGLAVLYLVLRLWFIFHRKH